MIKNVLFIVLIFMTMLGAQDEFTAQGDYIPYYFAELLDVEVYSPTMIYTFGVGGLALLDISDISDPSQVGRFDPGDIYTKRFYNAKVDGNLAIATARLAGLYFLDIEYLGNIQLLNIHNPNEFSYEGIDFSGQYAYAAVHENGVEVIGISNPQSPQTKKILSGLTNAWDVFIKGNYLYVADGSAGLRIFELTQPAAPQFVSKIQTSGSAKEVIVHNNKAYVSLGALGFDIIDVSQPQSPALISNFNAGFGIVNHLAYDNNRIFAATWELVLAVNVSDPYNPELEATEDTRTRAMGLAAFDDQVFVSDWDAVRTYTYQALEQPDIHVKPTVYDFGNPGENKTVSNKFEIFNLGESDLNISAITTGRDDFTVSPEELSVPPSGIREITVTYKATSSQNYISTSMNLKSDDPDEPEKRVSLFAGQSRLSVGEEAPDFSLQDTNYESYRLSDYRGKVVLLAFFASW